MTSLHSLHLACNAYPTREFFRDLKTAVAFCLKPTYQVFQRVYFHPLDGQNQIERDPSTGAKLFYTMIQDKETKAFYLDHTRVRIVFTCMALTLVTPVYTLGVMGWHCYQLFRATVIAVRDARLTALNGIVQERITEILKAPFFGLLMTVAAVVGVAYPYQGRKLIACIEYAWHRGVSYKEDVRRAFVNEESRFLFWCKVISLAHNAKVLYLAECFQMRKLEKDALSFLVKEL